MAGSASARTALERALVDESPQPNKPRVIRTRPTMQA